MYNEKRRKDIREKKTKKEKNNIGERGRFWFPTHTHDEKGRQIDVEQIIHRVSSNGNARLQRRVDALRGGGVLACPARPQRQTSFLVFSVMDNKV